MYLLLDNVPVPGVRMFVVPRIADFLIFTVLVSFQSLSCSSIAVKSSEEREMNACIRLTE